jgi:hypothetical protein
MFIHGGELSLAQTGGGPDLVRQAQPGRNYEICQKVSPARLIKGSAAPEAHLLLISANHPPEIKKIIRTGGNDGSGLLGHFNRCGEKIHCAK